MACDAAGSCQPHAKGTDPDGDCTGAVCDGAGTCGPPPLRWVRQFGDTGQDHVFDVAPTSDGGVILVGSFSGTINFGNGETTSYAGSDAFVLKLDAEGNHAWSRRFGDPSPPAPSNEDEQALSVTVANDGTAWVGLWVRGDSVNFGNGTQSVGLGDAVLLGLDSSTGVLVSADVFSGDSQPIGPAVRLVQAIAATSEGGLLFGGRADGGITVGGVPAGTDFSRDGFLFRLDGNQSYVWHEDYTSTAKQSDVRSVAVAPNGDVVVCGTLRGEATVGGATLVGPGGTAGFGFDAFVARLTPGGQRVWARAFGNTEADACEAVVVAGDGTVVAAGSFIGTIDVGDGVVLTGSDASTSDGYVVAYSSSGAVLWTKHLESEGDATVRDVSVDSDGLLTIWGWFDGTSRLGDTALESKGQADLLLARLSPIGDVAFVDIIGSGGFEQPPKGLTTLGGDIVVVGEFSNTLPIGGDTLMPVGGRDVFVARFGVGQ